MGIIEGLAQIARTRPEKINERKKGLKIGYIGRFVLEELIYATGALPYLLCGGGQLKRQNKIERRRF